MPKFYYWFDIFLFLTLISSPVYPENTLLKDKWQKEVPEKAIKLTRRGRLRGGRMRIADAIKDFEEALEVKKDYYWATYNLALAYTISSGDHSDVAEKTFLKAVTIAEKYNINDPALYDTFGQFYFQQRKYSKALEQCRKALSIDKKYVRALNNLGAIYEAIEKKEEALTNYKKAMDLGLLIAKDNYKRLFAQQEEKNKFFSMPSTYFTNKREGDPAALPPTYFDNSGRPGMPSR